MSGEYGGCDNVSRVQKFFLGSLLRYEAWRYPARISLSSDRSKKAVSGCVLLVLVEAAHNTSKLAVMV
ncbi:unnamed protein product [Acanthoscelides obtectus]|uniref:Uncharacterized protein n=1 Tax=Acanthoscelides obtectus TaxID=200917 RepID=A0A9P0JJV7_ACAOB|nr:unnamed protein product [Acanthoscelides obtectus]CAK1634892.1 hypothetical protein AOBTE_LOCUS8947 [Acanthoscelides obtectus]